jgi:exodeoxyribonuclease-1
LETFGLKSHYDRIAQFAAIRTDLDLNVIGTPIVWYCRLSEDYLPSAEACMVTGITPQEANAKGMNESQFISRIRDEFMVPNTTVTGFNSINFDDEFIRNALYRNLFDPYEREYANGCSRWDIINLVRAAYDLRPEGISWPPKTPLGRPSFKLTELTKANGIDQTGAHDALVDVRATVEVARLIKQKQPKLYNWSYRLREKKVIKDLLAPDPLQRKPLLYTSTHFQEEGKESCTRLIFPITASSSNKNNIYCFDLSKDISALEEAKGEEIFNVDGLIKVGLNRCEFVSPYAHILTPDMETKLQIDRGNCIRKARKLYTNPAIYQKLRYNEKNEFEVNSDVDYQIYCGFFRDRDQQKFAMVRNAAPQDKMEMLKLGFDDKRAPQLIWRYICRNWPETLTGNDKDKWKMFCLERLSTPPNDIIPDLEDYGELEKMLKEGTIEEDKRPVVQQLIAYRDELLERLREK